MVTIRKASLPALVSLALIAGLFAVHAVSPQPAGAQGDSQWRTIWGESPQQADVLPNPKVWKFRQSCMTNSGYDNVICEDPIGSATAAQPSLDDSNWREYTAQYSEFNTGTFVANHYRKTFTLADAGISPVLIEDMRFALQYDDTAVVYLNGHEIYRSIRGNLDPDYDPYGPKQACFDDPVANCDFPYDIPVLTGGAEQQFTEIPNYNEENGCGGDGDDDCPNSPYNGTPDPDPVDWQVVLDADGDGAIEADEEQVWAVTIWNRGGSIDTTFNHTFQLLMADAPPQRVQINEVQASNKTTWVSDIDGDGDDDTPDWIELYNYSSQTVDLDGWTLSDPTATFPLDGLSIPADDYLVIAANDCVVVPGDTPCTFTDPPQANFKISKLGDSLTLTNDLGFVEDETGALPDQFDDGTYGPSFDDGPDVYLSSATIGESNQVSPGSDYRPVLRFFPNRMYNVGETVEHQVQAFDPDNNPLTWAPLSFAGISMDENGLITGTATTPGPFVRPIQVSDEDGATNRLVTWNFIPAPAGPPRLVLNEYNAVSPDGELINGNGALGNGGDWFEFLVIEDNLDIRGWTIEIYDRKGKDDQLRNAASLTFANRVELHELSSGTLIVIGERVIDDLGFDGENDWSIYLKVTEDANGEFFETAEPGEEFNSTRSGNTVLIRDAEGNIVGPLAGETDAWDNAQGGVNGQEVMNLCVTPSASEHIDPVNDYRDNGSIASRGSLNRCRYTELQDPNDPNSGVPVEFDQGAGSLRVSATFGAGTGDVNCDGLLNIVDAYAVARHAVGLNEDTGPCFGNFDGQGFFKDAGDLGGDGDVRINDAYQIARCVVGLDEDVCPISPEFGS